MKNLLCILLVAATLSACSTSKVVPRGASYKTISYGSVTAKEEVTLGGTQTGIGAYVGSAAAIHDATSNSFLGFVVRGLAGSIVGAATEEAITRKDGMLYSIETVSGRGIEIATGNKELKVGACVRISNAGGRRVELQQAPASNCVPRSTPVAKLR